MKILMFPESTQGAVFKYRVALPAQELGKRGHIVTVTTQWIPTMLWEYELFIFQRTTTPDSLNLLRSLTNTHNYPVIYDMDDNVVQIPEDNPVLDLYLKMPHIAWFQMQSMRFADALTTTVEHLREVYKFLQPRSYVLPNCVDNEEWKGVPRMSWGDKVVLGWQGSPTHKASLELLSGVLPLILAKYPQIFIIFMGMEPPFPLERNRYTVFGGSEYYNFQSVVSSFDIGLAPLVDNLFNIGKSDLRLKEYGCAGVPAIASKVGEYEKVAEEAGVLLADTTDEWIELISRLIDDRDERLQRGKQLKAYAQKWDIRNHIGQWEAIYEMLIEEKQTVYPDVSDTESDTRAGDQKVGTVPPNIQGVRPKGYGGDARRVSPNLKIRDSSS